MVTCIYYFFHGPQLHHTPSFVYRLAILDHSDLGEEVEEEISLLHNLSLEVIHQWVHVLMHGVVSVLVSYSAQSYLYCNENNEKVGNFTDHSDKSGQNLRRVMFIYSYS